MSYSSSRHNGFISQKYERNESNFLLGAFQFPKKHCFLQGSHAFLFCPSDTSNIWMKKDEVVVTGENRKLRGNPVPVQICLQQTPQELGRTEAS